MQKKKKVADFEPRYGKGLPAIKKSSRTTHNSPKNMLISSGSPGSEGLKFNQFEGGPPGELFIKKFEESKKPNLFTSHSSPGISPQPKLSEDPIISKTSRELSIEEIIIPKKDTPDYMLETYSSTTKKIEVEQKHESRNLSKYKDYEIHLSKQKVSELQDYVSKLIKEVNELKIKLKNSEESGSRLYKSWKNSDDSLKNYQNLLKTSDGVVKELQVDVGLKQGEIQEMKELLKKAESKRRAANEQMNDVESKLVLFQRQISKLTMKLNEAKSQISSQVTEMQKKDDEIVSLSKTISELTGSVELEKLKSVSESVEFGRSKESLISQIEDLKMKLEKAENENLQLQELNNHLQQDQKKPVTWTAQRKSATFIDKHFLEELSREEVSRWHSRYFAIEEELINAKKKLEIYVKNDDYYKVQIEQKNGFIERLQRAINELEKTPDNANGVGKCIEKSFPRFEALEFVVQGLSHSLSYAREYLICENCFMSLKKGSVVVPCGHLVCEDCVEFCSEFCGHCAQKASGVQGLRIIERLVDVYERYSVGLNKILETIAVNT